MLRMNGPIRKVVKVPASCRERFVPIAHPRLGEWRARGIFHSGVSDLTQGYHVGTDRQGSLMMIATTQGLGAARTTRGGRHRLSPGTVFIDVPGGASEWATDGPAWSIVWWYMWPGPRWSGLLANGPRLVATADAQVLLEMTDGLIRRLATHAHGRALSVADGLSDAVLSHLQEIATDTGQSQIDAVSLLWDEVAQRLHEPWSLRYLAARLHLSIPSLQRLVRKRYQSSPHQVLLGLRMDRARDLLTNTAYPLRVIAQQIGFADQFGFSSAFRRHEGCSPIAFRNAKTRVPR